MIRLVLGATVLILSTIFPATAVGGDWGWVNPIPQGNDLRDAWAYSSDFIIAVGDRGTILQFDGIRWNLMSTPTDRDLRAVWGHSPTAIFAAGAHGTMLLFDGARWMEMDCGTTEGLSDIAGRSPTDLWAVCDDGSILHFNGTRWSEYVQPADRHIQTVWVAADATVFFGGLNLTTHNAFVIRLHGTTLDETIMECDECDGIRDIHGTSGSNFVAVDFRRIWQYDGHNWSVVYTSTMSELSTVWASSNVNIWASGGYWDKWPSETLVGFDGNDWHVMSAPFKTNAFAGTSSSDIWAVGQEGGLAHFDGSEWNTISDSRGISTGLTSIWGTSATDVFFVGHDSMFYGYIGNIVHLAGSDIQIQLNHSDQLVDVWGFGPSNVYAAGFRLYHFDGHQWSIDQEAPFEINAIWGRHPDDIYLGKDRGEVWHFSGTAWTQVGTFSTENIFGIWGTADSDVFFVGDNGSLLHLGQGVWEAMDTGTDERLRAVWGTGPDDVFAVGDGGTIVHFNGTQWLPMASTTEVPLEDVWGTGPSDVFAVGHEGTILHFDGIRWTHEDSGTANDLQAVWGPSPETIFAAGEHGTIIGRTRGPRRTEPLWQTWPNR